MKFKSIIFQFLILNFSLLILAGCGYKPTVSYSSQAISGKTYVDVKIDINNAQNSVLIKDALIELLIGKFNVQITSNKDKANSFITASLQKVSQTLLQTDLQGFAKTYRQTVEVKVSYHKLKQKPITFTLSNYYDFSVDVDSTVTQAKKDEAIKIAISKALSDIFSKIAINRFKK